MVSTFSHPAIQSMPPRLVDDTHLARTNALVSLTDELAIVLGPVAAGVGIGLFGFRGAFVFDAVTYAVGLAVLPVVRLAPVAGTGADGDDAAPAGFRDALDGWKLVVHTGVLRRVVACTFVVHLLYGAALLAEPLYVRDVPHRPPGVFAALQTVFGLCLVGGGVVAAKLGDRVASFRFVALGVGISGITAFIYLGTPWVAVAFAGVALWGVATAVIGGPSRTVLHRATPRRAHGRVLAADLVAGSGAVLAAVVVSQGPRRRAERAVRRLVYGDRPQGYAVLGGLGDNLASAHDAGEAADRVVDAVRHGLSVPWAAVWLYVEVDGRRSLRPLSAGGIEVAPLDLPEGVARALAADPTAGPLGRAAWSPLAPLVGDEPPRLHRWWRAPTWWGWSPAATASASHWGRATTSFSASSHARRRSASSTSGSRRSSASGWRSWPGPANAWSMPKTPSGAGWSATSTTACRRSWSPWPSSSARSRPGRRTPRRRG